MTRTWKVFGLAALACFGSYLLLSVQAQTPRKAFRFVRGTVVVVVRQTDQKIPREIALPRASVFLVRTSNLSQPLASNRTDLSGRFALKTTEEGVFTICVEAEGFDRTCSRAEFRLTDQPVRAGFIRIFPRANRELVTVFGEVKLRDGKLVRVFDPHAGLNSFARVSTSVGGARFRAATEVNNFGEYVIGSIPAKAEFRLAVEVEKERQELRVGAPAGGIVSLPQRYDFILSNASPRLRAITAQVNGARIQVAAPGSKVVLRATADDPDADSLEYRWKLTDGAIVGPSTDPTLVWTVPSRRGQAAVEVRITDNRGGTVRDSFSISVTNGGAAFSGSVVDPSGAAIGGAQVDVNGRLTNTNTRGVFSLDVPVREKYVLTIRKPGLDPGDQSGFGTASHVYQNSVTGGRWVLWPAVVFSADPASSIRLQHQRTAKDCFEGRNRIAWEQHLQPGIFDWQDGRGNSIDIENRGRRDQKSTFRVQTLLARLHPALARIFAGVAKSGPMSDDRQPPCGPGIEVEIPPNSLQDAVTRLAPVGAVRVSISTVDLSAGDQMPGDYSVAEPGGQVISMESFGAGSVEIGGAGKRYNLKPGATARVTIPVDGTQTAGGATLPPQLPFLFYDERNGVWTQDGEATLVGSGANARYVKDVTHFSAMNADVLKSGQSCLAVEVDPAASFTLPMNVEVTVPPSVVNPNVIQKRTLVVDSTKSNAIYNLPNNTDIVLVPIVPGIKPDGSTGDVPAGVFVVNTGGPQLSATNPPTPNPDGTYYAEAGGTPSGPCASRVTLKNLAGPTLEPGFEFLQGLYFESSNISEFEGTPIQTAIEQGAQDYYDQADPRELRLSFNLFKSKNRFGLPLAAGEAEFDSQYANSGDLGFGRDMHCRRNAGGDGAFDYACFVTNFNQPPADEPDQIDADDALSGANPNATVAMEYSRVENPAGDPIEFPDNDRAVKFFVYNTNQPDSDRLIKADLDNFGDRPVPQLCMICHGGQAASEAADPANPGGPKKGSFVSRNDIMNMNSQFLPFDLHLFTFPAAKSKAAQQAAFKNLNLEIVRGVAAGSGTAGQHIVEVVDNWYAGGSADQLENAVIAAWDGANPASDNHRLYRDVFARACRTCHISQPFVAQAYPSTLDFRNDITTVQRRVCNEKIMPHAKRTNAIFWTSLNPSMPGFLQLYGETLPGWVSGAIDPEAQCGLFYQGGGEIPSVFDTNIYPILTNNCSGGGCHSNVGNAQFSVGGGVDNTYDLLITAVANAGGNYIVANNSGASVLFQRISQANPGRMPLGGPDLATTDQDSDGVNDRQEILDWINLGAPR